MQKLKVNQRRLAYKPFKAKKLIVYGVLNTKTGLLHRDAHDSPVIYFGRGLAKLKASQLNIEALKKMAGGEAL